MLSLHDIAVNRSFVSCLSSGFYTKFQHGRPPSNSPARSCEISSSGWGTSVRPKKSPVQRTRSNFPCLASITLILANRSLMEPAADPTARLWGINQQGCFAEQQRLHLHRICHLVGGCGWRPQSRPILEDRCLLTAFNYNREWFYALTIPTPKSSLWTTSKLGGNHSRENISPSSLPELWTSQTHDNVVFWKLSHGFLEAPNTFRLNTTPSVVLNTRIGKDRYTCIHFFGWVINKFHRHFLEQYIQS